jgi:hypothetical protein
MSSLRLWTCTDHDTHWPVGGASIVVAENENMARSLLIEALAARGIKQPEGDFTLTEVPLQEPKAVVLNDGDY